MYRDNPGSLSSNSKQFCGFDLMISIDFCDSQTFLTPNRNCWPVIYFAALKSLTPKNVAPYKRVSLCALHQLPWTTMDSRVKGSIFKGFQSVFLQTPPPMDSHGLLWTPPKTIASASSCHYQNSTSHGLQWTPIKTKKKDYTTL